MATREETLARLAAIPNLTVSAGIPLSGCTRFGIGGPADVFAETEDEDAFAAAVPVARASGLDVMVIGGGTNLIAADEGYRGIVLRYRAGQLEATGTGVRAGAGASLQELVDFAVAHGLGGLETLSGIPGTVGGAVYGNAGAYGHSISERIAAVRFFDGARVRTANRDACEFHYRDSVFKRHKEWTVFSATLELEAAEPAALRETADGILARRNVKFPATMKCAGSIFKNLLLTELPRAAAAQVPAAQVREGKVPAAWFLEQVGAKGLRQGGICVAGNHANVIYNAGDGTARDLRVLIGELKRRVRERFGFDLEEEVQYAGFSHAQLTAPGLR